MICLVPTSTVAAHGLGQNEYMLRVLHARAQILVLG